MKNTPATIESVLREALRQIQQQAWKRLSKGHDAGDEATMSLAQAALDEAERLKYTAEESGHWVILDHFPHEPSQVYGPFDTEEEARDFAQRQGMGQGGACEIHMVINAHYVDGDPSDYAGMGWVGKDGRP